MCQIKEHTPTLSFSVVFIFRLAFESFKECAGVSPKSCFTLKCGIWDRLSCLYVSTFFLSANVIKSFRVDHKLLRLMGSHETIINNIRS